MRTRYAAYQKIRPRYNVTPLSLTSHGPGKKVEILGIKAT